MDTHLNRLFDRVASLEIRCLGRAMPAFRVCGTIGLVLAVALGLSLTWHRGLSLWVILILSCTSVAALLGQTLVMKVLTGEEELVYYRHEVAIVAVAALTLWLLGQPIWPYLDITILAIGAFLASGRVGCLMVGCCHGRPHSWGIRYSAAHADAGFTRHYVGVRLFPIQLVESVWVIATVAIGVALILRGGTSGEAFAWYVIVYDLGRFSFELVRGDPNRPYLAGFSEAQWTSLLLMLLVLAAESAGTLPFHVWHWIATGCVAVVWVAVMARHAAAGLTRDRLLHPRHVREVARALEAAQSGMPAPLAAGMLVRVARTSLGVQLSTGTAGAAARGAAVHHYTISSSDGDLTAEAARTLADLILLLRHASGAAELARGPTGAFHLVISAAAATGPSGRVQSASS
jgi:hypothetical protein